MGRPLRSSRVADKCARVRGTLRKCTSQLPEVFNLGPYLRLAASRMSLRTSTIGMSNKKCSKVDGEGAGCLRHAYAIIRQFACLEIAVTLVERPAWSAPRLKHSCKRMVISGFPSERRTRSQVRIDVGWYRRITPMITMTKNTSTMPWTMANGSSAGAALGARACFGAVRDEREPSAFLKGTAEVEGRAKPRRETCITAPMCSR
jgi:hypothetical protein